MTILIKISEYDMFRWRADYILSISYAVSVRSCYDRPVDDIQVESRITTQVSSVTCS